MTDGHIRDDAPGDQSRDLAEEHLLARGHPHHGRRAFVLGRGFGVPGHQETPRMVFEILHLAAHGDPVHVDVRNGHEDRNLQHLLLEVLVLGDDLRHDHAAVAGSEDQIGVVDAHPAGFAEEGYDEEPEQQQHEGAEPQQRDVRIVDQQMEKQPPQKQADSARDADDFVSFLIDSHNTVKFAVTSQKAYRRRRTAPRAAWRRSGPALRRDRESTFPNP